MHAFITFHFDGLQNLLSSGSSLKKLKIASSKRVLVSLPSSASIACVSTIVGSRCACGLFPEKQKSDVTCVCLAPKGRRKRLQGFRRDPLRDKIREVGRGLSLADTQTGRYGRLYSRRRLCARRGADARLPFGSFCHTSCLTVWPL